MRKGVLFLITLISVSKSFGQADDLFGELDAMASPENVETIATFKSTRVMLGSSTERVKKRQLQFRISHLFSELNPDPNTLFGIDDVVNMHLSFEYGLSDKIQLGISRTNKPDKTLQFNLKYSLIRQSKGYKAFPFAISFFTNVDVKTKKYFPEERNSYFPGRIDYVNMLLISRKINKKLSIQLSPTLLHRNMVDFVPESNRVVSLGFGGRYMLNEHVSVNWEYFYTIPSTASEDPELSNEYFYSKEVIKKNACTVGIDVETGGHVFQLFLSNVNALHAGKFLQNQNKDFFRGEMQIGFSLLREFSTQNKKKKHV